MKRLLLYFILGGVTGMFIAPALLNRMGIPTLGQWLNSLSGIPFIAVMSVLCVLILSLTIWLVKMAKKLRKEERTGS